MQLKTILNRVEYFKSFVYGKVRWVCIVLNSLDTAAATLPSQAKKESE